MITYRQKQANFLYLADLLRAETFPGQDEILWLVSWGFDVPNLLRRLHGRCVAYHAHSSGYGFDLPPGVPVLAVSRNTLGYWGDRAPRNPLFLVPNALEPQWLQRGARCCKSLDRDIDSNRVDSRPIDVLVQARKISRYVLNKLVPALKAVGLKVTVQYDWVSDLVELFNSSTVVLYDSAEYWRSQGVSEGFGLPPLEALACGCVVFSSLNHALADTIDPGFVGHQIGCGTLSWDQQRISAAVRNPAAWTIPHARIEFLLHHHSEATLLSRWHQVLTALYNINRHLITSSERSLRRRRYCSLQLEWYRRQLSADRLINRLRRY